MKSVLAFCFGFLIAIAACCFIGLAGYYTLSDQRLSAVVATGFAMAQFEYMPQARISEPFTDCLLLITQALHVHDPLGDLLKTQLTFEGFHPCDVAASLLKVPGHPTDISL